MRVYFDASVIIAALLSPFGGSSCLFKYIKRNVVAGITSQTVIDEILEEDKRGRLKKSKAEIEHFITQSGLIVRESITIGEIVPYQALVDVEDAHLLAGAVLTKCNYLVTLDKKHLLREDVQKRFLPLRIISPKELLEEIISD
jgi:putative PIN family toxin of toxin-antitoxin system